jgi:hypothetical protein
MLNTIVMLEGSDATCPFSMQRHPGSSSSKMCQQARAQLSIAERNSHAN